MGQEGRKGNGKNPNRNGKQGMKVGKQQGKKGKKMRKGKQKEAKQVAHSVTAAFTEFRNAVMLFLRYRDQVDSNPVKQEKLKSQLAARQLERRKRIRKNLDETLGNLAQAMERLVFLPPHLVLTKKDLVGKKEALVRKLRTCANALSPILAELVVLPNAKPAETACAPQDCAACAPGKCQPRPFAPVKAEPPEVEDEDEDDEEEVEEEETLDEEPEEDEEPEDEDEDEEEVEEEETLDEEPEEDEEDDEEEESFDEEPEEETLDELEEPEEPKLTPVHVTQVAAVVREENPPEPAKSVECKEVLPEQPKGDPEEFLPAPEFIALQDLLKSDAWPVAIPPDQICNDTSEDDKNERAEGILDLVVEQRIAGLSFLDFGCGEGHVAKKATAKGTRQSVGFDLKSSGSFQWNDWQDNCLLTTDIETVKQFAPYDVILLYDVLDHVEGEDPSEMLRTLANIKSPGGKIYVRCHPWCSRHGGHIYEKLNKAFAHVVFTEQELNHMGLDVPYARHILHPRAIYTQWFKSAGLDIIGFQPIDDLVEPFFEENPLVAARIKSHWIGKSIEEVLKSGKGFPKFQTGQSFLDFVLV